MSDKSNMCPCERCRELRWKIEDLMSCPFCGRKAHLQHLSGGYVVSCYYGHPLHCVEDDEYECAVDPVTILTTIDRAIEIWNRRLGTPYKKINHGLLWKFDDSLDAYLIYLDKPMPEQYNSPVTEIFRLEMDDTNFNDVVVAELVEQLNSSQ